MARRPGNPAFQGGVSVILPTPMDRSRRLDHPLDGAHRNRLVRVYRLTL
jgi:hypothetical protein